MGDGARGLRDMGLVRQYQKAENRKTSTEQLEEAKALAEQHGIVLQRFSDAHYRVRHGEHFWDIHPGNQRIRRSVPTAPFIFGLGSDWSIKDVVCQVAKTIEAWRKANAEAKKIADDSERRNVEKTG